MKDHALTTVLLVCACLVATAVVEVVAAPGGNPEAASSALPEFTDLCDTLDSSFLNPLRCVDGRDLAQHGKSFLAQRATGAGTLDLDPVVILPGLAGSGLEAKLHKKTVPHWYAHRDCVLAGPGAVGSRCALRPEFERRWCATGEFTLH